MPRPTPIPPEQVAGCPRPASPKAGRTDETAHQPVPEPPLRVNNLVSHVRPLSTVPVPELPFKGLLEITSKALAADVQCRPMTNQPQEKFRKDYRPFEFEIDGVELSFVLQPETTRVHSRIRFRRTGAPGAPLMLDGEDLELIRLVLDGRELSTSEYQLDDELLTLPEVPDVFELQTEVDIQPAANTQLSGLYVSSGIFCTQCEAEGFRRITFFPDRPDVMTTYRVRIEADREANPVLLSNGNRVEAGDLEDGRHFAVWEDPFRKPSYLFALVAGDLGHVHGTFTTADARDVDLYVYSEHENASRLDHALACLKSAMVWDEQTFGLQYDLDIYNIVAVNDFNMGAMENKSLNVFNAGRVLASPDTATDDDYEVIDGVIAHEYFHNWTGNRVTCRDWFQLTLKEGLTVFRDELYSADMTSPAIKRIDDVRMLRAFQFPEDAGPMAHPIRPDSYIAMDNFYTATVYEKGAEVIRMIHTLVGAEGFRKGMDLYFERHDGQAVTCDDFRAAMTDANGIDLEQFELWYLQAGTPMIDADGTWDEAAATYTLTLRQACPPTPGQQDKKPMHVPVACGLVGPDGQDLIGTQVLQLCATEQTFTFEGIEVEPVPSLLRGFSAPVRLRATISDDQLAFLMVHDTDLFNRWESGQQLYTRVLLRLVDRLAGGGELELDPLLVEGFRGTLLAEGQDRSLQALAMRLPTERFLGDQMDVVQPDEIHRARRWVVRALATELHDELLAVYRRESADGPYRYSPDEAGRRRLRNACLAYLSTLETAQTTDLCATQQRAADNMTEEMAALACLASIPGQAGEVALGTFYDRWKHLPLVVDKWLSVQASAPRDDTPERVDALLAHEAFDLRNPNKVRSLVRVFTRNQLAFNRADGFGYRWTADRVLELDPLNPQIAARTAESLAHWRRLDPNRQAMMRHQLERIAATDGISKDLFEIVSKALKV